MRLRLLKLVKGKLTKPVMVAAANMSKARTSLDKRLGDKDKQWKNWAKAAAKWHKALVVHWPAIERLHAKECPNCPFDGKTIFPNKEKLT